MEIAHSRAKTEIMLQMKPNDNLGGQNVIVTPQSHI